MGPVLVIDDWAAFKTHKTHPGLACRLLVRRANPAPVSQLSLLVAYSYHCFITDREGDPVSLDAWHRAHATCENAIRDLKYGVGLNHLPSGRFGANAAWLGLNVLAHNLSRWTVRLGGLDTLPSGPPPRAARPAAGGAGGPPPRPAARRPVEEGPAHQPAPPTRKSFVTTDTLRRCYLAIPGRLARSA